jgi:uncharacterized protein
MTDPTLHRPPVDLETETARAERHAALVRGIYEAYSRGDAGTAVELLQADVEIRQTELLPWGGHYRGHQGAYQFLERLQAHIESKVELERLVPAGDCVVAIGHTRGTVRANGAAFDVPIAHVWTIRDGRIGAVDYHVDTPALLAALARPPAA